MPTVGYDSQSFNLDGRRIWLVAGTVPYSRLPRGDWKPRLLAAKQAGLNTISVDVCWNLHEPRPGEFNFGDNLDLAAFVKLIGELDMFVILRPGPYLGDGYDFGGIPGWLNRPTARKQDDIAYRQANGAFYEACSRYLTAVMDQVRDLQVTGPAPPEDPPAWNMAGGAGPIVLVQSENHWHCHNPGDTYTTELVRYLRETGCDVPILSNNNLWQQTPGTIETWSAKEHLASDLRQLAVVQPEAPRFVSEYPVGSQPRTWQGNDGEPDNPNQVMHDLAQVLAAGGQYNIHPFVGGTNFGFSAGRTPEGFVATSNDRHAPISEAGAQGPLYAQIKRISTFASQFGHVLAHLDTSSPHIAISPRDTEKHALSVIHQAGSQGDLVTILRSSKDRHRTTELLLPNGLNLPVHFNDERAVWLLIDANLGGVAELTYSNLQPLGFFHRRMLVLYGPANATGLLALNGSHMELTVPKGKEPLVEQHDDVTLVVLNEEQVDACYETAEGLVIGANGVDANGAPQPRRGWPRFTYISVNGTVSEAKAPGAPRKTTPPRLTGWDTAHMRDLLSGESEAFEEIEGPKNLGELGVSQGYGWYRIAMSGAGSSKKLIFGPGGDRLHLFRKGKALGVFGRGPGTKETPAAMQLASNVVVLADNLGHFSEGWGLGEPKGITDHLYAVKPVNLGKARLQDARVPDYASFEGFVPYTRVGDRRPSHSITWELRASGKMPMFMDLTDMPAGGLILINDEPIGLFHPHMMAGENRYVLHVGEELESRKKHALTLIFEHPLEKKVDLTKHVKVYQATANATENATWSFAPWQPPTPEQFDSKAGRVTTGEEPCWHRNTFQLSTLPSQPLWLEPNGLSKGQILLNGHNVGRYFVADPNGKSIGGQPRYYLPNAWLKTDSPNELLIFEEHGYTPGKVKLVTADSAW